MVMVRVNTAQNTCTPDFTVSFRFRISVMVMIRVD